MQSICLLSISESLCNTRVLLYYYMYLLYIPDGRLLLNLYEQMHSGLPWTTRWGLVCRVQRGREGQGRQTHRPWAQSLTSFRLTQRHKSTMDDFSLAPVKDIQKWSNWTIAISAITNPRNVGSNFSGDFAS